MNSLRGDVSGGDFGGTGRGSIVVGMLDGMATAGTGRSDGATGGAAVEGVGGNNGVGTRVEFSADIPVEG